MANRNFAMDKVRMTAALVVMLGHLLHVKGSTSGFLIGSQFEKILSSGSFAVVVFFGLSGIALRYQTDRYKISSRWLLARIARLMPVYWVTLIPPIVVCYLLGVQISYPVHGFLLAIAGLQAVANGLAVPPVNGPLWSLSVELYLSASLMIIGKWRKRSSFFILTILICANLAIPSNPVILGLPIFYFGFLLPGVKLKIKHYGPIRLFLILVPISVLIIDPNTVQGRYQGFAHLLVSLLLAGMIVTWCVLESNSKNSFIANLSLRSYSLYAVHAPIILFIEKVLYSVNQETTVVQVCVTLSIISISTELLYRFVERPSIKFSRRILNKSNS